MVHAQSPKHALFNANSFNKNPNEIQAHGIVKRSIRDDRAQRVVRSQWDTDTADWLYFKDTTFYGYYTNGSIASEKIVFPGPFGNFTSYSEFEYDGGGRILRNIYFYVNQDGSLDTSSITAYTYDGDILTFKKYQWREGGSTTWTDWEETRSTYDLVPNTDRLQSVVNEFRSKADPNWEIEQRLLFEYNSKNQPSKLTLELWNPTENKFFVAAMYDSISWRNWVKNDHPLESSEFNMVEGLVSFLGNSRIRLRRTFDSQNNLIKEITYMLNGTDSLISEGVENIYTYDMGTNRTLTRLESRWLEDSASFVKESFYEYGDFFTPTALKSSNLEAVSQIFPNPALNKIQIVFSGDASLRLELISLNSGQKWMDISVQSGEDIDVRELPSGIYSYRLTGENRIETGKLIKE